MLCKLHIQLWSKQEGNIHFVMGWLGEDGLMGLVLVIQTSLCVLPSHFNIIELLLPVKTPSMISLRNWEHSVYV